MSPVGRAATHADVPAVAACLADAFHEDPLWGHWTFPDEATRAERMAGKGLGTALIEDNLARIDAEHLPAYLESTNPVNLPRYEALGFAPRSTLGPPGGPVVTTMWRSVR